MTLVILAAGMGSRFGGTKQLEPVGPHGEIILDYSVYDAWRAGFDRVLLLIKPEHHELFRDNIECRFGGRIKVEYAFQTPDMYCDTVPPGRVKPWGTGHALLCCSDMLNDNFAVINADDFYGRSAFTLLAEHLAHCGEREFCLIGYRLANTVTDSGTVSRGICEADGGVLKSITERRKIAKTPKGIVYDGGGREVPLPDDTVVSMTTFGFTPAFLPVLRRGFADFLTSADRQRDEFYLPTAVQTAMDSGFTVRVRDCADKWYGVTYREDREAVREGIARICRKGCYDGMI